MAAEVLRMAAEVLRRQQRRRREVAGGREASRMWEYRKKVVSL